MLRLHGCKYMLGVVACALKSGAGTWNYININQSEASIYSLLRKASDYWDNLNLV